MRQMARVVVVDGQGGGIGKQIIERLRAVLAQRVHITALGTNALATALMLRAGADEGASGENAVVHNASRVDVIVGPVGIIVANSMLGELTSKMAAAIADSPAQKVLIPLNRCRINIVGSAQHTLPAYIEKAVDTVCELLS